MGGVDPGARIGHPQDHLGVRGVRRHRHPGPDAALRRVHRVVDQVAEDGDQITGGQALGEQPVVQAAVPRHHELHAPLVGLGRLAEQQRGQHGFPYRRHHLVGQGLGQLQFRRGELHRLLGPAQLDQGHHRVQAVGGLVRLRAQGLGEAALRVQLAHQRLEFGDVPQGDHGAAALSARHRGGVHHQDPGRGQMHLVHPGLGGQQRAGQRGRQAQLGHRAADQLRVRDRQAQQLPAAVVDQRHPVLAVQHQQALAHRVQRRLVVVVHVAQLGGVHAVGVPAQPGVDDVGADRTQQQCAAGHPEQGRDLVLDPGADLLHLDAGAHQTDDAAVLLDRGHRADGGAEGAGVGLGEGVAVHGGADTAEEALADLRAVGVGPADPVRVHDRDEVDVRVPHDLQRVRLQGRRGVRGADRRADRGGVRDRAGHRRDLADRRVLGLPLVADVGEQRVPGHDQRYQHGLHREQLARQAAGSGEAGNAHVSSVPPRSSVN